MLASMGPSYAEPCYTWVTAVKASGRLRDNLVALAGPARLLHVCHEHVAESLRSLPTGLPPRRSFGGMATDQRRTHGELGERIAEEHLAHRGYTIVARNFRTRYGEIDLVAADSDALVFCEVKKGSRAVVITRGRSTSNAVPLP